MDEYDKLFKAYVADMRRSKKLATEWWEGLLRAESKLTGSKAAAERSLAERWPHGPASHPYVIATYRKYFLACQELYNKGIQELTSSGTESEEDWDESQEEAPRLVAPRDLVLDMLHGRADDLVEFLGDLVFAPIGSENDKPV